MFRELREMRKISKTTIALLCIIGILTIAFATVLYTLDIPSQWGVSVAYGLELEEDGLPCINIDWGLIARYSTSTKNFVLYNVGTHDINVTLTMPDNTARYEFATTFVNTTILFEGSYAFNISLTDLNMESNGQPYSGNFVFDIVDSFPSGNENLTFEPTEKEYLDDTIGYLEFVSDSFNATEYVIGDLVEYQFTTKAINESATIDSFSYNIELYEGLTWISQIFSGMKDCVPDLQPQETITLTHTFDTTLWNSGIYTLHIVYTGHNSEEIPEEPQEYTYTVEWSLPSWATQQGITVNGFTIPNEASTVQFAFRNNDGNTKNNVYWKIEVVGEFIIANGFLETLSPQATFTSAWLPFNSPSGYGSYVILVTVWW